MNQETKMPLIRLAKRDSMDPKRVWAIRLGSILVALLLGSLVITITGNNPFTAYATMISGSLGRTTAWALSSSNGHSIPSGSQRSVSAAWREQTPPALRR